MLSIAYHRCGYNRNSLPVPLRATFLKNASCFVRREIGQAFKSGNITPFYPLNEIRPLCSARLRVGIRNISALARLVINGADVDNRHSCAWLKQHRFGGLHCNPTQELIFPRIVSFSRRRRTLSRNLA